MGVHNGQEKKQNKEPFSLFSLSWCPPSLPPNRLASVLFKKKKTLLAHPRAVVLLFFVCSLPSLTTFFPSLRFIYGFHLRLVCWMDSKIDDAKKTSSLPVEWNAGWPMNVCEQALTGAQRLTPRFCYFL